MSHEQVEVVVGTAVIDGDFRRRLLTNPSSVVQDFALTVEESRAIESIRARSLEEFARKLRRSLARPQRRQRRAPGEREERRLRTAV